MQAEAAAPPALQEKSLHLPADLAQLLLRHLLLALLEEPALFFSDVGFEQVGEAGEFLGSRCPAARGGEGAAQPGVLAEQFPHQRRGRGDTPRRREEEPLLRLEVEAHVPGVELQHLLAQDARGGALAVDAHAQHQGAEVLAGERDQIGVALHAPTLLNPGQR